ncbi:GTP 3',8-cyclase MoaA [Litoribacter alkaliphilus]|uniref:GTP 3',8-cyclase n=1 Tax=Litoribacter ruber TaxID=702568 RepID=A0AAP2CHV8_9BACT|nr:GTP 3',8-cyclase MoaA [Litoribacter alkaliphilus]MBS9524462.1 GTP 3',8-cyclase MoaA [Litoribacter alkaliphilus]
MLIDKHHRVHDYLRISLTDSCNFRCSYCMPDEDTPCLPQSHLMSENEIIQIAKVFVSLGVTKIRLTGGEPMVRKGFASILKELAKLPVELTMTSNGVLIDKYLADLKTSGMKSVNISLDTLDKDSFFTLTKRNQFDKVWENINLLLEHNFRVKINVVAIKGKVEKELLDFIQITKKLPLHVRFIEFMPFDGNRWDSSQVVTAQQMLQTVMEEYDIVKLRDEPHATAKKFKAVGHEGTFAFITTMSEHFCGSCNRMRLTADGKMKNCLFGSDEMDLLGELRKGNELLPLIIASIRSKHKVMGGQFSEGYQNTSTTSLQNRSMIKIGG